MAPGGIGRGGRSDGTHSHETSSPSCTSFFLTARRVCATISVGRLAATATGFRVFSSSDEWRQLVLKISGLPTRPQGGMGRWHGFARQAVSPAGAGM